MPRDLIRNPSSLKIEDTDFPETHIPVKQRVIPGDEKSVNGFNISLNSFVLSGLMY